MVDHPLVRLQLKAPGIQGSTLVIQNRRIFFILVFQYVFDRVQPVTKHEYGTVTIRARRPVSSRLRKTTMEEE